MMNKASTNSARAPGEGGAKEGGGEVTSAVNQLAHTEHARLSVQLQNVHTKGTQAHLADEAMVTCLVSTVSGSSNGNEPAGEGLLMDTCYHHVFQQ